MDACEDGTEPLGEAPPVASRADVMAQLHAKLAPQMAIIRRLHPRTRHGYCGTCHVPMPCQNIAALQQISELLT